MPSGLTSASSVTEVGVSGVRLTKGTFGAAASAAAAPSAMTQKVAASAATIVMPRLILRARDRFDAIPGLVLLGAAYCSRLVVPLGAAN